MNETHRRCPINQTWVVDRSDERTDDIWASTESAFDSYNGGGKKTAASFGSGRYRSAIGIPRGGGNAGNFGPIMP
jgi:hypothetical protein